MPFAFKREYTSLEAPDGPSSPDENVTTFERVLSAIETLAAEGVTPEELYRCVKIVHCGATFVSPRFEPGVTIYRARCVSERPRYMDEIGYPPARYVRSNGRCNAIGESMFYGSIGQPNAAGALYECRAKPGEQFAIGTWITTLPLVVNHMGYSNTEVNGRVPDRPVANWMIHDQPDTRNAVLRAWDSEIFTRVIAPGDERQYNLSMALTKLGLEEARGGPEDVPHGFGGLLYPSICTNLMGHNVALRPTFVDTGLRLRRVDFCRIRSIELPATPLAVKPINVSVEDLDFAVAYRADGQLLWASENTYFSAINFR